jgi:hypothetical protein
MARSWSSLPTSNWTRDFPNPDLGKLKNSTTGIAENFSAIPVVRMRPTAKNPVGQRAKHGRYFYKNIRSEPPAIQNPNTFSTDLHRLTRIGIENL